MLFTTQWLSTVFPNYQGDVLTSSPIAEVTTDSRSKTQQSLFIPLVGDRFDGHHHIKQALDQGAIAMIWDENRLLLDLDRKSTRLNSSHVANSYAVFCLKKKNNK